MWQQRLVLVKVDLAYEKTKSDKIWGSGLIKSKRDLCISTEILSTDMVEIWDKDEKYDTKKEIA